MNYFKAQWDVELLRFNTAGSVDDGKSTLIGRLLHDYGVVFEDQLAAVKKLSEGKGFEEMDFSLLLDGLSAEREQGITIDVAYRYFATGKRKFIIADTPGHEQYTRNMVTGASTANMSLILVDIKKGLSTQSKRHLFIASLLGIPHILIVVNKMDLIDYNQDIFEKLKREFSDFALKLGIKDLQFIPISALKGDMIVKRGKNMPWYDGMTMLSYLENLQIVGDNNLIDFRMPVAGVVRTEEGVRGYVGKIEGGVVKRGDKIMILPSGVTTKIKSIIYDFKEQEYAFNPQSVMLVVEDEVDVSRGDVLVREKNLPQVANELEATVCWLGNEPMVPNRRYILKHGTRETSAYIEEIKYKLNIETLHRLGSEGLEMNEIGRVSLQTKTPLIFDVYSRNRNTGNFVLIDEVSNNTVGAGIIIDRGKKTNVLKAKENFVAERGIVLWFTGLSGSGKSTIAEGVYKFLCDRNIPCERLDGDVMRESLSKDLGFGKEDREMNIERAGFVANLLSKHGVIVLASFISPYEKSRGKLKEKMGEKFVEIFVDTSLEICEKRDIKGLYGKARAGEIPFFTGISDDYEAPENPDIRIDTNGKSVEDVVEEVLNYLIAKKIIVVGE